MSWYLTAGHLVAILEKWDTLSEDARYLYKMYLLEKSYGYMQEMNSRACHYHDQGHEAHAKNLSEHARNSDKYIIDDIVLFGTYALEECKEFGAYFPSPEKNPKIWERYRAAKEKVRRWLEQVMGDGSPYSSPPKTLGD